MKFLISTNKDQRPDLVIVNWIRKSIYILELTVPYESNITMEHKYKSEKYARLIGDLQDIGWSTSYHAFEVGWRSMITKENATILKLFITKISKHVKQKIHLPILKKISKSLAEVAMLCSFSMLETIMCGIVLHISNLKFTPCSKAFNVNPMF